MKKGTIINVILILLIIISSIILLIMLLPYIKENLSQEEQTSIQIKDNVGIVNQQQTIENTYTISNLEPAGESVLVQNNNNETQFLGEKYFYNQLNEYAKTIYQGFEKNIENLKTGIYKIEFNGEFDELLKQENGNEMLNDEFQRAWDAFSYDRPDVFYLNPNKFSLTVETTKRGFKTTYKVYIDAGQNENYLDDGFSSKEEIEQAIEKITNFKNQFVKQMSVMSSDYERIKSLHDWIIENIEYDSEMQQVHRYNICGALVDRKVVCEGYAKLFKYILDNLGMKCILASGIAVNSEGTTERHMWNYVQLDGKWYAIDCTWDDPIIIGGGKLSKEAKYKYFLKGAQFYKDHTEEPITEKSESLVYPKIEENDYQK